MASVASGVLASDSGLSERASKSRSDSSTAGSRCLVCSIHTPPAHAPLHRTTYAWTTHTCTKFLMVARWHDDADSRQSENRWFLHFPHDQNRPRAHLNAVDRAARRTHG